MPHSIATLIVLIIAVISILLSWTYSKIDLLLAISIYGYCNGITFWSGFRSYNSY